MAKRGPKPVNAKDGHPYYELGSLEPIPHEQADFCARRVGGLASFGEAHRPLKELLANAYWLGMQDTVEAFNSQGLIWKRAAEIDDGWSPRP